MRTWRGVGIRKSKSEPVKIWSARFGLGTAKDPLGCSVFTKIVDDVLDELKIKCE